MDVSVRLTAGLSAVLDARLNSLRRLSDRLHLIRLVRALRMFFHFGPWRAIPQYLIRRFRPVAREVASNGSSLLKARDVNRIVEQVRHDSVSIAGTLPEDFVAHLRQVTDRLPLDHYQLMHLVDNDIHQISADPGILDVLRAYFRCEPVLLESTLVVTGTGTETGGDKGTRYGDQNYFHFDFGGWESLNVFVYLTDVTNKSSHHSVARGSHRGKRVGDFFRTNIGDAEAATRFGDTVFDVTGPAGTVFFENTEAFHRRDPGSHERRVMLNLLYASHRSWFSHGRTSVQHLERRKRLYREVAAAG